MPPSPRRLRLLQLFAAGTLLLAPGLAAAAPPGPAVGEAPAVAYTGGALQACGANATGTQTVDSGSFQSLVTCNLSLGQSGQVLVLANASVGLDASGDTYEANFRVDHNTGLTGDNRTDRYVDAYPDSALQAGGDGTDRNVAISALYTVTAGVHTFALLAKRTEGTDPIETIDATISALFIPAGGDLRACSGMWDASWPNSTNDFYPTVKCALTVPRAGLVFVSADGWVKLDYNASPPYQAAHQIVMDGSPAAPSGLRLTDVYTNTGSLSGDGIDTTVAATQVFTVTPGVHEFALLFQRESGAGPGRMADAALAALYVPFDSGQAQACFARGAEETTNTNSSNAALASCSLSVPAASWALVSGTAGVGLASGGTAFEAQFHLALDSTALGLTPTSRYVNSYPDAADGLDGSMADAVLTPLTAGAHTFHILGRRFSGSGNFVTRTPVLFVLVPGVNIYLPQILK